MTKKEIREIFHQHNIQLSPTALDMIVDDMRRQVRMMALRCNKGNVKRLTEDLYYIAIGKLNG